jgi:hypothetical protein
LEIKVFLYTWIGVTFLLLFMSMFGFSLPQNTLFIYGFMFLIPILFMILALFRNRIFRRGFKRPESHRKYLQFTYGWRILVPFSTFTLMFYYSIYGFHDPRYFMIPFVVFFFFTAVYMIFDGPLTKQGEIVILFEMLSPLLNNFHEAQRYWERIAKKLEQMLNAGNIGLTSKDLVYYFSKKLLETTDDISTDLVSIRDWMLGRRRSCFEALQHINPEIKLAPCKRNVFIESILAHPDVMIKYIFAAILIAIFLVSNPDFVTTLLKYLGL